MEAKLQKIADLKVKTGEYTDKDGKTRGSWQTVGALFGTPHHSRLTVKLYATAYSDERWLSVYYDEDKQPNQAKNESENGIDF